MNKLDAPILIVSNQLKTFLQLVVTARYAYDKIKKTFLYKQMFFSVKYYFIFIIVLRNDYLNFNC